ncbi:DUF885 domain-containing protein [Luteimonas panaciterrae]|uniref:DUF885 domain-containing protein n=1 Tax=Luteimonas panaciterrae TaxID=363885 RepID=UPI001CF93EFE|nr:DUF885 domain-containing protein [Luteimonas panaciterrae]
MKPLVLALALALSASIPLSATSAPPAATATTPAWVTTSNDNAMILIKAQAQFSPEEFSFFGIPGYDDKVSDFGPRRSERFVAAMAEAKQALSTKLQLERDPNVRQDLEIMIHAADEAAEGSALYDKLTLPWSDVPQTVFSGMQGLLSDQTQPERRTKALDRLKAYVGLAPGSQSVIEQAKARYEERASDKSLLRPTKLEVEQSLGNVDTFADGIRKLFAKYQIAGAEAALDAMDKQLHDYAAWTRSVVLPEARSTTQLPPELYAYQLKQVGIDIDPQLLMRRAQVEFMETRAAMRQLAPQVAKAKGLTGSIPTGDYIAVIRALKKKSIPNDQLEGRYRKVIDAIDPIIRRERIVDVPQRPMVMRLGSPAESAAQPAPHFLPAPLVGNTGQQGQFVLPVAVPNPDGTSLQYDDFNYDAAAWTLSAHEGRPGHELQFTAMVERGVSLARSMFAFNSVNVEGWALYAEAEMVPYEPVEGQMIALQLRLLRAARAILDPMLNLGLIDRERAGQILENDVGVSKAMAKQELDRYMFNAPGQAGSYFYGYSRILELRMQTELALGAKFDRLAFNNFLIDQGMLPPDLLGKAVREQFVPAQK